MVINVFASYLNGHDSVNWYFPTYFAVSARSTHKLVAHEQWVQNACEISKLDRFGWRLKDARQLKMLDYVFEDEIKLDMVEGFKFANLEWEYSSTTFPIQKNDFNCGVYVIRNMQHYRKKWDEEYVSNNHRASLAIECIKYGRNEFNDATEMVRKGLEIH